MSHCFRPHAGPVRRGGKFCGHSLWRTVLAVSALAAVPFADFALGAVPNRGFDSFLSQEDENSAKNQAAATISGSIFPGVIDCRLQRPAADGKWKGPDINISYPSIGNTRIDEDIREWVTGLADAFTSHLNLTGLDCPLDETRFDPDALLNSSGMTHDGAFELWGEYRVSRPSDKAISIAFEIWNYTGSPEANLDILTLNYSLLTGQRLDFVDIFEKPDIALQLMSQWSRKTLEPRLGASRRSAMLANGTAPRVENFSSLTLTPEGVCINFQPWQVASSEAGIQKVVMPLEELMPSAPLLALWGK